MVHAVEIRRAASKYRAFRLAERLLRPGAIVGVSIDNRNPSIYNREHREAP